MRYFDIYCCNLCIEFSLIFFIIDHIGPDTASVNTKVSVV